MAAPSSPPPESPTTIRSGSTALSAPCTLRTWAHSLVMKPMSSRASPRNFRMCCLMSMTSPCGATRRRPKVDRVLKTGACSSMTGAPLLPLRSACRSCSPNDNVHSPKLLVVSTLSLNASLFRHLQPPDCVGSALNRSVSKRLPAVGVPANRFSQDDLQKSHLASGDGERQAASSGGRRAAIGDRADRLAAALGRIEPLSQRLGFGAQRPHLGLRLPGGAAPFALPQPGCDAPDDDAGDQ